MSEMSKDNQIRLFRKLQIWAPALMILIAALIYAFWDNDSKTLIAGVIGFLAIPDFLTFKFLADRLERM